MVTPTPSSKDITGLDKDRMMAMLCYLSVLVFIPLVTSKNNPSIKFHAKQGLLLVIGYALALFINFFWSSLLGSILFLLLAIVNIIALVQTLAGRNWKIPLIGNIAEKITV